MGLVLLQMIIIAFNFKIGSYYSNGYSGENYRQTTNIHNPWKVNLAYSGEGQGAYTTFWLDRKGYGRVSEAHDIKQGSGNHYYDAYSTANASWVRLGAENNNYNGDTYTVTGYWDEETD